MKICPRCLRQFEDDSLDTCPDDGTGLKAFSDQASQLLGQVLDGRWLIEEKIGEGGMGEVYRARQVNVDRVVAVKVLRLALASTEQYVARFFREADIATSVQHPHFVSIFDFGQTADDQLLYIAMELLEGEPLSEVMRKRRLELIEMLTVVAQVCAALSAAHESSIVHRDLKPDNIFLLEVPEGGPFAKVLDFGIAKDLDSASKVTRTGQLFGTPEYMSPEQCEGGDRVDGRSDLYAVGCILYELLSGRSPFQRESIIQTLLAQVSEDPKPFGDLGVPVPRSVERVVMKLLEKHPDNRYANAIETRAALLAAIEELKDNSVEIRSYETVSSKMSPKQSKARTVSYSELGHPLQLEGVLASSARAAIANEADKRRHAESEKDTHHDGERSGAHPATYAVLVVAVLLVGVAAYVLRAQLSETDTASDANAAFIATVEAVDDSARLAEVAAARASTESVARRRASAIGLHAVSVALGGGSGVDEPDVERPPERPSERPKEVKRPLLGVRTQTSMSQRLLRRQAGLLDCYNRREDPADGGTVEFRFTVAPDGTAQAKVSSNDMSSKTVISCMQEVAEGVEFAPADTAATFVKSLEFSSKTQ